AGSQDRRAFVESELDAEVGSQRPVYRPDDSRAQASQLVPTMATIEQRLEGIKAEITALCEEAGRSADDLVLVAVSKNHPADSILTAYQAGHRDFGESRFQELRGKAAILPDDI